MNQDHKINRYFFLVVILLFAGFLLFSLKSFFTAFLAAIMFYVLSKQPVEWLIKKHRWKKSWAALLIIIVSFFIILLPISLMAAMLYKKALTVSQNTSQIIEPLKQLDANLQERFHFILLSEKNLNGIQSFLADFISSLLNQGLNLLSAISMMYFFLYFMIININRMEAAIIFYLPFNRQKIELFGQELKSQTFSNAIGVPLIAVVIGLFGFLAFSIIQFNEPGFWAVILGFSSIIPIVGTAVVWLPISIYLFSKGQIWQAVLMIAWGALLLSVLDNIVRFLLAKKMADVHPIVTVLGVIIGLEFFGITGLIFGPLIISYFIILLKIYYNEYQQIDLMPKKKKTTPMPFKLPFLK
ncbi:MAG: AI-2E family transporter [Sphingobacteriia bacterium]|jgi:predicted PurR-regulated permease PerM|nr:MAG: AI-2E family transporter [Sphingobacteriia bacterium]TAG31645.1 MAG: AI-2E family transporter [Sphingobacteriia bacterium]